MNLNMKRDSVYIISAALTLILVVWAVALPGNFETVANFAFALITGKFGWFYMLSVSGFLFFSIWLAFSKYGKIRLGSDDSRPEYSTLSWFAMLFSSGMGIGLVFWGVAEPLNHYMNPLGMEGGTAQAAEFAIGKSFLHWSLHPWACFCVIGLGLAYMQFRKNQPGLISRLFLPLLGEERVNGWIGKTIDVLAIIATVAGVCTSLGLGTMQINSGLNYLFGVPETKLVQVIIIVVITFIFVGTAVAGIEKGIALIANANMFLAGLIVVLAFIVGPTVLSLNVMTEGIGVYIQNIIGDSFGVGAFSDSSWYSGWTIFYWAWWVAWAPFVGSFIARISKGRTIREFVGGVLLVPALLSFLWFGIFGSMGINLGPEVAVEAIKSTSTACFVVFSHYPLGKLLSIITIMLVSTFFITSANSATFVLGIFTSHGDLNPSGRTKLIWGIIESALALVLLVGSTNGLQMMQNISIVGAFPFVFVMIGAMFAIAKSLRMEEFPEKEEKKKIEKDEAGKNKAETMEEPAV